MIRKMLLAALGALFVQSAHAEETGLAAMHDWKAEKGGLTCMATHFHDGAGQGATRKEAEQAAILAWREFTSFEYGSPWDSYKRSASKTMNCFEMAGAKRWSCSTSARPCKVQAKKSGTKSASR